MKNRAAEIHAGLKHPVIDGDGHWLEPVPVFLEYLGEVGGAQSVDGMRALWQRNHGLLTVSGSVEESVGWFVMAERVAEVHVKAPNARPISDEAAAAAASTLAPHPVGCSSGFSARSSPIARWSTEQRARLRAGLH